MEWALGHGEGRNGRIVVVGLGYVGLPLAVALADRNAVIGFDLDPSRVDEIREGRDRTREVPSDRLQNSSLHVTSDEAECFGADIYVVTVPTPVDRQNRPDLTALLRASQSIGRWIDPTRRPTIVFESTVYPGCTEGDCGPAIEAAGGLLRGRDFRLGYSPERINPGDKVHTVNKIIKVVAGEDDEVLDQLAALYGEITEAGVFRAASIKTAEAAKVIENAQRDINIAFMNEVAQIFSSLGVSMNDVLAASRTKWNFLPFEPGLVGGHCIGVDPYYLSHAAQAQGHHPQVILAGRETNDGMGRWVADQLHRRRGGSGRALILGLTFKENVPDLRNSKVIDLVRRLEELGHDVSVADPLASAKDAHTEHGIDLVELDGGAYDLVVGAVSHDQYRTMGAQQVAGLVAPGGTLADLKGMWRDTALMADIDRWSL